MSGIAYYDYKKDFPQGNGWIRNEFTNKFIGELIDAPNYIFTSGKYRGKSLQSIVESCWRGLIKYVDYGLIYITKECIDSLVCSGYKKSQLKAALDSKLTFCKVLDYDDEYTLGLFLVHIREKIL